MMTFQLTFKISEENFISMMTNSHLQFLNKILISYEHSIIYRDTFVRKLPNLITLSTS